MAFLYEQLLLLEEEENENIIRPTTRRIRRALRDAHNPFEMAETQFIATFRLSHEAAMDLVESLSPHLPQGHGFVTRIPNHLRILMTLHFFAIGSYQRGIGNNMFANMSQAMVSKSIREVTNNLVRHFAKFWIRFPRNEEQKNVCKEDFLHIHRMEEIIGIVDGTHIAIVKPLNNEHVFVNRKGYHSLNVQLVCDAQLKIMSCNARYPGSTHDSFVWRSSVVGGSMRGWFENGDHHSRIMGDSGYPCLPWLLVPLTNPANEAERNFNIHFKRVRSTVERCIGVLKGRFRCLLKDRTLHYFPRNAGAIVMACAILHNICLHYRVDNPQPIMDDIDGEEIVNGNDNPQHDLLWRRRGQLSRAEYINTYY